LQALLQEKFNLLAGNGSCVKEAWESYKGIIFEGVKFYVPQKILSNNPNPECYNKEVKQLNVNAQ